jgi:hypothetical protein
MKLIISLEVEKGDALTGADLSQLITHVLAVRDLAHGGRVRPQPQPEATRPEPRALARREPDRGDAWEPPFDAFQELPRGYPGLTPNPRTSAGPEPEEEDPEESPPADGRQLLGWAAKQDPDAKGTVMSFGKRNGFPSKIVSWTEEQVRAAYRHAKGAPRTTGR